MVLLLLVGAHWLAVTALTTYDGWRIARFKEASGSPNLLHFARGRLTMSWTENGWGHCIAALSCLTEATTEQRAWTAEAVAVRERELDAASRSLEAARAVGRACPVVRREDDFPGWLAELHQFATISAESARAALRRGDVALAERRLDDAWFLCDHATTPPSSVLIIVRDTSEAMFCEVIADHLQRWSPAFLDACTTHLSWDWKTTLFDGLRGDVYYQAAWWDRESPRRGSLGFSPTGLAVAYERHRQLSAALDAIDDPFAAPTLPRVGWQRAVFGPGGTSAIGYYARQRAANRAVVREAIRLERARRETGTVPAPTTKVGGFTIASKQTPAGIELTTPDAKPSIKVLVKP